MVEAKIPVNNLRRYGSAPFSIAVIHGGPGAPGYMAPVARELSPLRGVLEPLQTATSLEGQVQELHSVLEQQADWPVTLIGSSWGAMLSFIFAARYPAYVKKIILVGSAVYEEKYAANIQKTRFSRLSEEEKEEILSLLEAWSDPAVSDKTAVLARESELFTKADAYDPLTLDTEVIVMDGQYELHQSVWREAAALRRSGELLQLGKLIQCPVVAIHGEYDPHPSEGVRKPLSAVLKEFRFILLKHCGHLPWIEREAKDEFYRILEEELCSQDQKHCL
jgi:pimeloyl-ACP methyl ester carboxylesterase